MNKILNKPDGKGFAQTCLPSDQPVGRTPFVWWLLKEGIHETLKLKQTRNQFEKALHLASLVEGQERGVIPVE